jgi:hypothetical protein
VARPHDSATGLRHLIDFTDENGGGPGGCGYEREPEEGLIHGALPGRSAKLSQFLIGRSYALRCKSDLGSCALACCGSKLS